MRQENLSNFHSKIQHFKHRLLIFPVSPYFGELPNGYLISSDALSSQLWFETEMKTRVLLWRLHTKSFFCSWPFLGNMRNAIWGILNSFIKTFCYLFQSNVILHILARGDHNYTFFQQSKLRNPGKPLSKLIVYTINQI